MNSIRNTPHDDPQHRVRAELTTCRNEQDCVAMTQGENDEVKGVVVFKVEGNAIARYDMCMPGVMAPLRSGVFPI